MTGDGENVIGMNASRSITPRNNRIDSPAPIVVLCGPTAAGKTTLAGRLAQATSVANLDPAPSGPTTDEQRLADLALLRALDGPCVVESTALPHLLPVDNHTLVVRLTASTPVRARRFRHRKPEMSQTEAHHLLELADVTTHRQLRSSWGIDIATPASRWRTDLILGCPDQQTCPDEATCTDTVAGLLTAAFQVYVGYLTSDPADALDRFTSLRRAHPAHVRRCGPALIGPVHEFTPAAWRTRTHTELERRAGIL